MRVCAWLYKIEPYKGLYFAGSETALIVLYTLHNKILLRYTKQNQHVSYAHALFHTHWDLDNNNALSLSPVSGRTYKVPDPA